MRETLRAAAQKAALRACLLYIGERPVAFASGILSKKTLYGTFMGYDPGFKKYCPGLQTLMRLIEESFQPTGGLLRIDAGCGDSSYKRALFDSSWKEAPVWIFALSVKGLSLHVRRAVSTFLHSLAMGLLARSDHLRKSQENVATPSFARTSAEEFRQDVQIVFRSPDVASPCAKRVDEYRTKP